MEYIVFKTPQHCPWCDRAIDLLTAVDANFSVQVMGSELKKTVMQISGMNTVPIIQRDATFIGGFTELKTLLEEEGQLDQ